MEVIERARMIACICCMVHALKRLTKNEPLVSESVVNTKVGEMRQSLTVNVAAMRGHTAVARQLCRHGEYQQPTLKQPSIKGPGLRHFNSISNRLDHPAECRSSFRILSLSTASLYLRSLTRTVARPSIGNLSLSLWICTTSTCSF